MHLLRSLAHARSRLAQHLHVLVDPTHPEHFARLKRERPGSYRILQAAMTLNAATPMAAELRGTEVTSRQWHNAGPPPACPPIFLTATRSRPIDGRTFAEFTFSPAIALRGKV